MRGHASIQVASLALGLLHFRSQRSGAKFDLRHLFAVEGNAIFGAIQIERRLPQQVVHVAQFGVELVGARAQPLLLGGQFLHRLRVARLDGVHIPQQVFQPRRFDVQMRSLARQHDAQQPAHLFA